MFLLGGVSALILLLSAPMFVIAMYQPVVNIVACAGRLSPDRLIYHEHLAFLLDSMGNNPDRCGNEKMLEMQLYDILEKRSINFDGFDMKDREKITKEITDKGLFSTDKTPRRRRPTLQDTTIDSQVEAFKFLHDIHYICKLRRSMTAQYISFIGAHRAGKSSLLKSLWNIPAQRGDHLSNRTQQMNVTHCMMIIAVIKFI